MPVRSGEEALKALLVDEFAVILLDVVMPGMDGFETAAHIKRRPKTRDVPIIFLTAASAEPDHAFRGYAAGAVDYISKPFDPWVLRAKVSVFVELYVKNRQLREQAELLRSQLDTGAGKNAGRGAARRAIPALSSAPESADPRPRPRRSAGTSRSHAEPDGPDSDAADTGGASRCCWSCRGAWRRWRTWWACWRRSQRSTRTHVLADCAAQLEHRVGRLRDALDALRVG